MLMGNWFGDIGAFVAGLTGNPGIATSTAGENPSTWISGIGGDIAGAIESGFLALTMDIWSAVLGPLQILLGSVVILIALSFLMSEQLASVAPMLAGAFG